MIPFKELKKYSRKADHTYTLGAFPTFELLKNRPDQAVQVVIGTQANREIREKAERICKENGIPLLENDRALERIRDKEACILAGVLRKYRDSLEHGADHVVLVNPGDMGNLGTIVRTCAGFGVDNLAVIEPAAEIFHPKTIRASMGALFSIHFERFASFADYRGKYGKNRDCYPFMLKGAADLGSFERDPGRPFSLIFGNEAAGLDDSFLEAGRSVVIRHSGRIDSLNLSMAAGIALYEFTKGRHFL